MQSKTPSDRDPWLTPSTDDRWQQQTLLLDAIRAGLADAEANRLVDDNALTSALDEAFGSKTFSTSPTPPSG